MSNNKEEILILVEVGHIGDGGEDDKDPGGCCYYYNGESFSSDYFKDNNMPVPTEAVLLKECDINLCVALEVRRHLERHGVKVILSRTNNSGTRRYSKLQEDWYNDINNGIISPALVMSMHTNIGGNNGFEATYRDDGFAAPYKEASKKLSQIVTNSVKKIAPINPNYLEPISSQWYILNLPLPGMYFELGYMDNPLNYSFFDTPKKQRVYAKAYAEGILEYFGIPWQKEKIAIELPHGGNDTGVFEWHPPVGLFPEHERQDVIVYEKNIILKIGKDLYNRLIEMGYEVLISRLDDTENDHAAFMAELEEFKPGIVLSINMRNTGDTEWCAYYKEGDLGYDYSEESIGMAEMFFKYCGENNAKVLKAPEISDMDILNVNCPAIFINLGELRARESYEKINTPIKRDRVSVYLARMIAFSTLPAEHPDFKKWMTPIGGYGPPISWLEKGLAQGNFSYKAQIR